MNEKSQEIFAHPPYSYVLSKNKIDQDTFNLHERILPGGMFLYHSPLLDIGESLNPLNGNYVVTIGLLIHANQSTSDNLIIAKFLNSSLNLSENCFLESLDKIAGRFVVIYGNIKYHSKKILGDAFGSLKITYSAKHEAVSSNIFLINKCFEGNSRNFSKHFLDNRKFWKYGVLGNSQPLEGYSIVTPNHFLDLTNFKSFRFYPRRMIQRQNDIDFVCQKLIDSASMQTRILQDKYVIFQSLTAGLDSRLSLALNSNSANVVFFTYLFDQDQVTDAKISLEIARKLNLTHCILSGSNFFDHDFISISRSKVIASSINNQLTNSIKNWDWYCHGNRMVSAYYDSLVPEFLVSNKKPLHIRSNFYETVRVYWGSEEVFKTNEILKNSRRDWLNYSATFSNYFAESSYSFAADCGYNLLDIFYWEHRCGTWLSEVIQGTDFAFNTHAYINCREIVDCLLGIQFEERKNATAFRKIINSKLSALSTIPINPK